MNFNTTQYTIYQKSYQLRKFDIKLCKMLYNCIKCYKITPLLFLDVPPRFPASPPFSAVRYPRLSVRRPAVCTIHSGTMMVGTNG